ncbi:MAG: YigZ family protein [Oscillospiraceae bacterium]|nr:YigZ family protein [Oscillospiraceae bacterium]
MEEYFTVGKAAVFEFVEKKSRFIGYVQPVKTDEQAQTFINTIKSKHPSATHNVYAYTVLHNQTTRYSDDGEPQGTAGLPVLDVLRKNAITNTAIVVTRYFGGTLLGTGGLVRAYSKAAAEAVKAAGVVTAALCSVVQLEFEYSLYSKIEAMLAAANTKTEAAVFEDSVKLKFCIRKNQADSFIAQLQNAANGKIKIEQKDEKFAFFE